MPYIVKTSTELLEIQAPLSIWEDLMKKVPYPAFDNPALDEIRTVIRETREELPKKQR